MRQQLLRNCGAKHLLPPLDRSPLANQVPGYPLPWSVYTWLPGESATAEGLSESNSFATGLSVFIAAVRNRHPSTGL